MLSIVIPVFNEALNVELVSENVSKTLEVSELAGKYEVIFVNDGSTDETSRVIRCIAEKSPNVRALHHVRNVGYGGAIKTGFDASNGEFVTVLPGDGEMQADQTLKLYRALAGASLVTSKRANDGSSTYQEVRPPIREFLSRSLSIISRLIIGFDPQERSGVFMIRHSILRSLSIYSKTGAAHIEILYLAEKLGTPSNHTEIHIHPRLSGKSKVLNLKTILRYLKELIYIRRRHP